MPFVPHTVAISAFGVFEAKKVLDWASRAVRAGADGLMLRESWPPGLLLGTAELWAGLRLGGVQLLLNPSTQEAVEGVAALPDLIDGIHVKSHLALPKRKPKKPLVLGKSCHVAPGSNPFAELLAAHTSGADYVTLSPVFRTQSHPGAAPIGLEALAEACRVSPLPILALGGVTRETTAACLQAGAHGVAAIGWFR